jgi:hypothetical protein
VATFTTYAEALQPDHAQMKLYEMGTLTRLPGEVLGDILRRTGGAYETTFPLTPDFRSDIREAAELTSDAELRGIADLSAVPVSLEHLRHLDPRTRIVLGARLQLTPAESERLGRPRLELPPDPRTTVLVDGVAGPDVPVGAIAPSGMRPARTLPG